MKKLIILYFLIISFMLVSISSAKQTYTGNFIADELRIPRSTSPTVNKSGEIALDTDGDANITQGFLVIDIGGTDYYIPIIDATPSNDAYALTYDLGGKKFTFTEQVGAGTGGSEAETEGWIFDSDAETVSGIWTNSNDVCRNFGTSGNIKICWDTAGGATETTPRLEFRDTSDNPIFWMDPSAKTFSIAAITLPEVGLYDVDSATNDTNEDDIRADQYAGGMAADFYTTTEDDEDSHMWFYVMENGVKVSWLDWDAQNKQVTMGMNASGHENLIFDFEEVKGHEVGVKSDTGVTQINFGSIGLITASLTANAVTDPAMSLFDSDAVGTARADEFAGAFRSNLTTTTEDDEIADVWITAMADDGTVDADAAEVTIWHWDGSDYSMTFGDPVGDKAAEDLILDFSTGTPNEITVTSNTLLSSINFGTISITASGFVYTPVAEPEHILYDSEGGGSATIDKWAAAFGANFTTNTEDDEIADAWISAMVDNGVTDVSAAEAKIFEWDGSEYTITLGDPVLGPSPSYTPTAEDLVFNFSTGIDDQIDITSNTQVNNINFGSIALTGALGITADSDGHTVSSTEAYGYVIMESGDLQTVTLPSAVAGMNMCVWLEGADGSATVYLDCDIGDHFEYSGTTMDAGEYIYNVSDAKDDYICVWASDADTWKVIGYRGTLAEQTP